MKYESCFGTIPIKKENLKWQVFLLQHRKGNYWGFPKGHLLKEEKPFDGAKRELKEETNLEVVKKWPYSFSEEYQFERDKEKIQKKVLYFLVEVKGNILLQKKEILQCKWVDIKKAISFISFTQSQKIMFKVAKILENK